MTTNNDIKKAISREADYECLKRIEGEVINFYLKNNYSVLRNSTIIDQVLKPSDEVKRLFSRAEVDDNPDNYEVLLSLLDKKRMAVRVWRKRNKKLTLSPTVDEMIAYLIYDNLSGAVTQNDNDSVVLARCERGLRAMHYLDRWYDLVADAKAKAYHHLELECRAMGDSNLLPEQKRVIFSLALTDALYENICTSVLYLKEDEVVTTCDYEFGSTSALSDIVKELIRKEASIITDDNAILNDASAK